MTRRRARAIGWLLGLVATLVTVVAVGALVGSGGGGAATADRHPAPGREQASGSSGELPVSLTPAVAAALAPVEYHVVAADSGFRATNPAQDLAVRFSADAVQVRPAGTRDALALSLERVGRSGAMSDPPDAEIVDDGARVEYRRGSLTEWYVNDPRGLEQGFTLTDAPRGDRSDPIVVEVASTGGLRPVLDAAADRVRFDGPGSSLDYSGLHAYDAEGTTLPARLGVDGRTVTLTVDDADAVYPITIDPLLANPQTRVVAGETTTGDKIGSALAVSGDTAVVGVPGDDTSAGADAGSAYVFVRTGTTWTQQAHLFAPDAAEGDGFGFSVAMDGSTLVVGARTDDTEAGSNTGSAHVFVRSGTTWTAQAQLQAADAVTNDLLGASVAIDGDTVIVGAPGRTDYYVGVGVTFAFVRSGTTWSQQARLDFTRTAALTLGFGKAVAISGDTAVVGAPDGESEYGSSAYVFVRNGTTWTEQAAFPSFGGTRDHFGTSVAIEGDTLAIGAPDMAVGTSTGQGNVQVYVRSGTEWDIGAIVTSPQHWYDRFGASVALSGGTLAVGAPADDSSGGVVSQQALGSGAVYVFTGASDTWTLQATRTAVGRSAGDGFGAALALDGNTAVVGAPGRVGVGTAQVIARSGSAWTAQGDLVPTKVDGGDQYGSAVAVDGNTAVVGAPARTTAAGARAGAAYVLVRSGGTWNQQAVLLAADGAAEDGFGSAVSVVGDTIVVGAPTDDTPAGLDAGSAHVFKRTGATWTQQAQLLASDAAASDRFGSSVAVSGDTAIVGAPLDDLPGKNTAGSVYVFVRSAAAEWSQQAQRTASDSAAGDQFGSSVGLSGTTAVVGAPADDTAAGADAGSAYVLVRSGTTWSQQAHPLASDAAAGDAFGSAVAVSGNTAIVGAPMDSKTGAARVGSVYVLLRSGTSWTQQAHPFSSDGAAGDHFGASVAVSGNTALVGAPDDDTADGSNAGSAYVLARTGATWAQDAHPVAPEPGAGDAFGRAVAVSGDAGIVGAPLDDAGATADAGSVQTYRLGSAAADVQVTVADAVDPVIRDYETVLYNIKVDNLVAGSTATNLALNVPIPARTRLIEMNPPDGWTCAPQEELSTDPVSCSRATLAPTVGTQWFTLEVVNDVGITPGSTVTATATVTADGDTSTSGNNTASASTTIVAQGDITVSVAPPVNPVAIGDNITYTITVANAVPTSLVRPANMSDLVPEHTTFVSRTVPAGWDCESERLRCSRPGGLTPADGPQVFTLVVKVNASIADAPIKQIRNIAHANGGPTEPQNGNAATFESKYLPSNGALRLTQTASPSQVAPGSNLTYQIVVNPALVDPAFVTNAAVNDALPANTTYVSRTVPAGWTCANQAVGSTNPLSCTRAKWAQGHGYETGPYLFTLVVKVNANAPMAFLTNRASATSDGNAAPSQVDVFTLAAFVGTVSVSQQDSPDPVVPGNELTYKITVKNPLARSNATTITLNDALPTNTTFVSRALPTGWTCAAQAVGTTNPLSCTRPSLRSDAGDQVFTVVVKVNAAIGSSITNTARVTAAGDTATTGDNVAAASTAVAKQGDLSVTQTDAPDPVVVGGDVTYTITVQNSVASSAVNGVVLTDTIPANTSVVSRTFPAGWTCNDLPAGSINAQLSCTIPGLAPANGPQVFTLVLRTMAATAGSTTTNVAKVSAIGDTVASGNNVASSSTAVLPVGDIRVLQTDSPDPVVAGTNLTYQITVENLPANTGVRNVVLTEPIPSNTTFVSRAIPAGWTCTAQAVGSTSPLSCTRPILTAGPAPGDGPQTFTLVVKVAPTTLQLTPIRATATVTAAGEVLTGNNVAVATTAVTQADVRVLASDSPDPVVVGNNITYTITVENLVGTSTATDVEVYDSMSNGTATFVSRTVPAGWTCAAQAVGSAAPLDCSRPSLGSGPQVFTLVLKVVAMPSAASVTNSAEVSAAGDACCGGNNRVQNTTAVLAQGDVSIVSHTATPNPVQAGNDLTYKVTVKNVVAGSSALNVALSDPLPANTTYVSRVIPPGWSCTSQAVGSTTPLSCTRPSLTPADLEEEFTLVVRVNAALAAGSLSNVATVTATGDSATSGNNRVSLSTAVVRPDVNVTLTDSPDPVHAGANLTYVITARNLVASSTTPTLQLTTPIPANTTFVSRIVPSGWTCANQAVGSTTALSCTRASLAAGSSQVFTMVVKVAATASATSISASAQITAAGDTATSGNNVATATTAVTAGDVTATLADTPDPVHAGANLTYRITATNAMAGSTAVNVAVKQNLPANTTFVSRTVPAGWTCASQAVGSTTALSCTRPSLAAGPGQDLTMVVKVAATASATTIPALAQVTATGDAALSGNNVANASTAVTPGDVTLTLADTPDPVHAGANLTYTLTATNVMAGSTAVNVAVKQNLPANTTFVSRVVPTGWTCATQAVGSTNPLSCTRASLVAGSGQVFTMVVKVAATASATTISAPAQVTATGDAALSGNNVVTATTPVTPGDVTVTQTASPDTGVVRGSDLTYRITVQNAMVGSTAVNVAVNDAIPGNTTFVSRVIPAGWSCAAQAAGSTDPLSCTRPSLLQTAGAQVFTVVVRVGPATAISTPITHQVWVSSTGDSAVSGNNLATVTTSTVAQADVRVTMGATPDPVIAGDELTYAIAVSNPATTSTAANVVLTDGLPAGTTFVSRTVPAGWTCAAQAVGSNAPLSCTRAALLPLDGTQHFSLVVRTGTGIAGTTITNQASVSATGDAAVAGNNVATTTTAGVARPDIQVTMTDSPDPVLTGGTITYGITVANPVAASTAKSASLLDELPASTTFVSRVVPAGWSCASQAAGTTDPLSCVRPTLTPADGAQTFTLVVRLDAAIADGETVDNEATVSAQADAVPSNNVASTTTSANRAPSVTVLQAGGQSDPTSTTPIAFQVDFSEPVTGFTAEDVSFAGSGAGPLVAAVSGGPASYAVAVSGMDRTGSVRVSIPAGAALDADGGPNVASTAVDGVVTYQVPTVTIDQALTQVDPTSGSTVHLTAAFSAPVTGFTGGDVLFTGSTGAGTLSAVVSGGPTVYDVAVSGMTGSGTVVASVPAGAVAGGNAASTSTDNAIAYDHSAPTVTIDRAVTQADPAASSPVAFTVTFSEPVTGFDAADVSVGASTAPGALTAVVTGGPAVYEVAVSGMTGSGTVVATVAAGAAADAVGHGSTGSTSADNSVQLNLRSVTVNKKTGQADPARLVPINFTVTFSTAVTDFTSTDVSLTGTAPGALSATVTGGPTTFNVAVSGMTGPGTVIASLPANVVPGGSSASTSTDNVVTFDNRAPTVTVNKATTQADPANATPVTFTVTFSEPVTGFVATDVLLAGTAPGTRSAVVTGGPSTYTVAVSGLTGSGTVVASVPVGRATDAAGNGNTASTSTDNVVALDLTAPSVTVDRAEEQVDPTNATPIHFTAVFSEPVTGFTADDVSFVGSTTAEALTAVVTGGPTVYDVEVSGMTTSGEVVVSIPGGAAADALGNGSSASTSTDNAVTHDVTPPSVTIEQAGGQTDPTNAGPVRFTAVFSEPVTGFTADAVSFEGSTEPESLAAVVTGGPTVYDVEVSGMGASGSVVVSVAADAAADAAGNSATASTSTDATVTYDIEAPSLTVEQALDQADPTNAAPVRFTAVFSEPVTGFTAEDVSLDGSTGAEALSAVVTGGPSVYDIAVSGMTTSGSVVVSVPEDVAADAAGNGSTMPGWADRSVTYDVDAPTVTVEQAAGQADPTNVPTVRFTATFDEEVTGFTAEDVSLAGSTEAEALAAVVTGGPSAYDIEVAGMTTSGTVVVAVPAGAAVDAAGLQSSASTSTDGSVTFDVTSPTVIVELADGQADPTNAGTVRFTAEFGEPVTGFTAEDVSLDGSTDPEALAAVVTGGPSVYDVEVSGAIGTGEVVVSVPEGAAADAAGNGSSASTSTDDTVAYDLVAPEVVVEQAIDQADPTNAAPIRFTVTFSEPVAGFAAEDVSFAGSAEAEALVAVVTGGPSLYEVEVSGMTTSGTVVASVPEGAATDPAGNGSESSTSADGTVAYDIDAPTVTVEQAIDQADPTGAAPVRFTVTFSEAVTGFTADDVSFEGSTEAEGLTAVVTEVPGGYEVEVSGMTTSGSVVVSVPAGAAVDAAGNASAASTSTDGTVAYEP